MCAMERIQHCIWKGWHTAVTDPSGWTSFVFVHLDWPAWTALKLVLAETIASQKGASKCETRTFTGNFQLGLKRMSVLFGKERENDGTMDGFGGLLQVQTHLWAAELKERKRGERAAVIKDRRVKGKRTKS